MRDAAPPLCAAATRRCRDADQFIATCRFLPRTRSDTAQHASSITALKRDTARRYFSPRYVVCLFRRNITEIYAMRWQPATGEHDSADEC
jgi:hypothetical protein